MKQQKPCRWSGIVCDWSLDEEIWRNPGKEIINLEFGNRKIATSFPNGQLASDFTNKANATINVKTK